MAKAAEDDTTSHHMQELSERQLQALADRLYSRSITTSDTPERKRDLRDASRTIRALLSAYELAAGRQLRTLIICGEGC